MISNIYLDKRGEFEQNFGFAQIWTGEGSPVGPKKSIKLCQLHVNIYNHFFVISESLLEIRAEGAWEVGEKRKSPLSS